LDVCRLKTRVFILTLVTMIAFASNSLLCRAALRDTGIDAATFTFIRIFSGALALWLILQARRKLKVDRTASPLVESSSGLSLVTRHSSLTSGNWISAFALFAYAAAFSFAYNTLSAGTGALLLFGAVQATMIFWGLRKGERLDAFQIIGLIVAITGLVVLVFPGLTAPPLIGSILMLGAGVAWGVYSLRGKVKGQSGSDSDPIAATTGNFLRAVPFAILLSAITLRGIHFDSLGAVYAFISGAVTSGLGYVIWYTVLPELRAATAAAVQLSAPVLAATGGILLLSEPITLRYVIASVAVLGGIFLIVIEKQRSEPDLR
jgi:drug/metabolite transporter (DMT)-like permease